jgi:hypothetical protein
MSHFSFCQPFLLYCLSEHDSTRRVREQKRVRQANNDPCHIKQKRQTGGQDMVRMFFYSLFSAYAVGLNRRSDTGTGTATTGLIFSIDTCSSDTCSNHSMVSSHHISALTFDPLFNQTIVCQWFSNDSYRHIFNWD